MNGAQALLSTLAACRVDTCFMNPGTSEMHFVAALDSVPTMRGVLALFEGVATGAADGYARMAGRPAAVLLHLGPGLGNGLANLHNARKARSPVVAIVGDHATYHKEFDTPLESDIETVARNVSSYIRRSSRAEEVGTDAVDTVAAACGPPGQVATLILPSDVSWTEGAAPAGPGLGRSSPAPPEGYGPALGSSSPAAAPEGYGPAVRSLVGPAYRDPPAGRAPGRPASRPHRFGGGGRLAPGRTRGLSSRRSGLPGPPAGGCGRDMRSLGGPAFLRDLSRPAGARGGPSGAGAAGISGRGGGGPAAGPAPPGAGRCPAAGVVLRLPGQAELSASQGLPGPHPGRSG